METASNKIVAFPEDRIKAIGKGIIVKATDKFCKEKTEQGIVLTGNATKKYDIGEVIAIGESVAEVKIGDIVLYQAVASVAYPIPNGMDTSYLTKIDEVSNVIIAVIPAEAQ